MLRTTTALLAALAVLAMAGCKKEKAPAAEPDPIAEVAEEDRVIDVADDDAAMNQAIAEARAHVEVFADQLASAPSDQTFSVKKPFPYGDARHEHMWLVDVKAIDGGFDGRLDNQPRDATDVKIGQRYPVGRDELSDWLISDGQGRMWGGYTLRVMLPAMDPDERAAFEQALQPLPAGSKFDAYTDGATASAAGKRTIGELKQRLVAALTAALKQGVPEAIAVCNTEAPAIAAAIAVDGITVGRATRKPRNPGNLATGWQADALSHFEAMVAAGTPLDNARFSRRLLDGRVAYAEPLVIQPLCLTCHGANLAPEVRAALAARYPDDQATGYAVGDLRGVVWTAR